MPNQNATTRLAFIGLGIMGNPMAGHLLGAGYPLTVFTRTKASADDLLAHATSILEIDGDRGTDARPAPDGDPSPGGARAA